MKGSRILIVEDEMIIAMEIRATLKKLGYEVAGSVISGFDAIQTAADKMPDLVLMDIRLKGEMDGIDAAKKIMELYDIPVIFLTGNSDRTTVERAVAIKPAGFLTKPFNERELFGNIEMAIHKHKVIAQIKPQGREKSEDIHAKKFSSYDAPLISADGRGVVTRANDAAKKLIGEDTIIVGKRISEIFSTSKKPQRESDREVYRYFWPDSVGLKSDEKIFSVNLKSGFIADESNDIKDFIFLVEKAGEEKQGKDIPAEEFTGIIDSFSEIIFITDLSMNFLYYNNNFLEFSKRLGINSFQLTRPIYEVKELLPFAEAGEYVEVFRTNHSIVKIKKFKSAGKEINYFRVVLTPGTKDGRVTHVVIIIEDITSVVSAREHIQYITQNLDDIKTSLLSANEIVGEINGPLFDILKVIGNRSSPQLDKIAGSVHEIEVLLERFNVHKIKYEDAIDHIVFIDKTIESW